jgi:hypothetical protein
MSINNQIRTLIDSAVIHDRLPVTKNAKEFLTLGSRRFRYLTTDTGALSPAGRYFYDQSGIAPPIAGGFKFDQAVTQKGSSDYIRDKRGGLHLVRN